MNPKHPVQPLITDENGHIRFKENKIVLYLLEKGLIDLNKLAALDFSQEDREQFAQLVGYSLSGFGELSYVSEETYQRASEQNEYVEKKEPQLKHFGVAFNACLESVSISECELTSGDMDAVIKFKPDTVSEIRAWGSRIDRFFRVLIEEVPGAPEDGEDDDE